MMNIQDWGALGELVAAIATVLTLVYLAMQIRANTTATTAQVMQALTDSQMALRALHIEIRR